MTARERLDFSKSELAAFRGATLAGCPKCGSDVDVRNDRYHCAWCGADGVHSLDVERHAYVDPMDEPPAYDHPVRRLAAGPAWIGVTRAQLRALVLDALDGCAQHELEVRAGKASGPCPVCERVHAAPDFWHCAECGWGVADGMRRCFPCEAARRVA